MNVRELLDRLVAFPTVSRDSNLPLIHFVQDYLDTHRIASTLVPNDECTKSNLYATIGPNVPGGVVLSGHTDVVPIDGQSWHSDPFTVTEKDGLLYGRGTCDMKAFIATALALLPEMQTLQKPIHLALSYDEEVGCAGAPRMIEQLVTTIPTPIAVIVGEPTELQVVSAHKGIVCNRTTVTGHEAHSSQTQSGVSAVMTAARLVTYLDDMAQSLQASTPSDNGFDPAWTTVHVGTIEGGTAINIISRHCEFVWDLRNIPQDDPQELLDRFEHYCHEEILPHMRRIAPETHIETVQFARAPAFRHDPESAAVKLVQTLTNKTTFAAVPFAAEAGQFQEAGFSTVICGPGSIDQAHKPDEFISLEQLHKGEAFVRALIRYLSAEA
jgi:acetylornithine deacetylase